jgi:hypothetical protein
MRKLSKSESNDVREIPGVPSSLPFPGSEDIHEYEELFWSVFSELPAICQSVLIMKWKKKSIAAIRYELGLSKKNTLRMIDLCLQHFTSMVMEHQNYKQFKSMYFECKQS